MLKIIKEGLKCGIYKHTIYANKELSMWNINTVLMDKVKDLTLINVPQLTFNYFNIIKDLSGFTLVQLNSIQDFITQLKWKLYSHLNIKHRY